MSREPEIETRERIPSFRSLSSTSPREEKRETLTSPVLERGKKKGTGETGLNKSRLLLATDPVAIWRVSFVAKRRGEKRKEKRERERERERERAREREEKKKKKEKKRGR